MWNFFRETGRWFFGTADKEGPQEPPLADPRASGLTAVDEVVRQLFRQHQIAAEVDGGSWILLPQGLKLQTRIHQREAHQRISTVQLDVVLELADGRTLIESFAGVGEMPQAAVFDALENFQVNSLHVLLAAFFGRRSPQIDVETWMMGGQERRVVVGGLGIRGQLPGNSNQLAPAVKRWEEFVRESVVSPGIHWLRLFYAQKGGEALACEALRDNETWSEAQEAIAAAPWPVGDDFYSARLFVILLDS